MAQLQYIGARYVPKYYQNSQDPSSSEWESGKVYEALIVVTYQDDSYISKIPVPSNIGDPASFPAYWAKSSFNAAAVTALQQEINDIVADIEDINDHKISVTLGDIEITRYFEDGYSITVTKILKNKPDGSQNKPILRAQTNAVPLAVLAHNTKAAQNFCFTNSGYTTMVHAAIVDGVIVGDDTEVTEHNFLVINDDGTMYEIRTTTSNFQNLINSGVKYCGQIRCQFVKNGQYYSDTYTSEGFQSAVGVDNDGNYYLITMSLHSPLYAASYAAWLINNIPGIKDVYACDSGGSSQTMVNGARVSQLNDVQSNVNGDGRNSSGAFVFESDTNNTDITSIGNIINVLNNNNAPKLRMFKTSQSSIALDEYMSLGYLKVVQQGNLVWVSAEVTINDGCDNAWHEFNVEWLPNPAGSILVGGTIANLATAQAANPYLRLHLYANTDQTSIETKLAIRSAANSSGNAYVFDINFVYLTNQAN